jgi:hypothetical protein
VRLWPSLCVPFAGTSTDRTSVMMVCLRSIANTEPVAEKVDQCVSRRLASRPSRKQPPYCFGFLSVAQWQCGNHHQSSREVSLHCVISRTVDRFNCRCCLPFGGSFHSWFWLRFRNNFQRAGANRGGHFQCWLLKPTVFVGFVNVAACFGSRKSHVQIMSPRLMARVLFTKDSGLFCWFGAGF